MGVVGGVERETMKREEGWRRDWAVDENWSTSTKKRGMCSRNSVTRANY